MESKRYMRISTHHLAIAERYCNNYWVDGEVNDLEKAASEYAEALAELRNDSDEYILAQLGLADVLRIQYEDGVCGEDQHHEARVLAEGAMARARTMASSELHLLALRVLGEVLLRRFHACDPDVRERAAELFHQLLLLAESAADSNLLVKALSLRAGSLNRLYEDSGDSKLADEANTIADRLLSYFPDEVITDPEVAFAISDSRFMRAMITPNDADWEQAIRMVWMVIRACPSAHPRLHEYWDSLGIYYLARWRRQNNPDDFNRSFEASQEARSLVPQRHPLWHMYHGNYAVKLYQRYTARSNLDDLDEAVATGRTVFEHLNHAPSEKRYGADFYTRELAVYLRSSFAQTGKVELLDEAIALHASNVHRVDPSREKTEMTHLGRAFLTRFGMAYLGRFAVHGRRTDVENAVSLLEEAIKDAPFDFEHWFASAGLANALLSRFNEFNDTSDLERAISVLQTALTSEYPSPVHRGHVHSLLGLALLNRYREDRNVIDIRESIQQQQLSLEYLPQEHSEHHVVCFRLGLAEYEAFVIGNDLVAIDRSTTAFRLALSFLHEHSPDRALYMTGLGRAQLAADGRESIGNALKTFREAATHIYSQTIDRYSAAVEWARASHESGLLETALEGYRLAISLLPDLAWLGLEHELRMRRIAKQVPNLPQDAAACAIELGHFETAVELSDAGRSLLWNTGQELRADLGRLRDEHPELARELAETNMALEYRPSADGRNMKEADQELERRRLHRLANHRTKLLHSIREMRGFERFLLSPSYEELQKASQNGPVVLLNSSSYRCDALLLRHQQPVLLVPLPTTTHEQLHKFARMLQAALRVTKDNRGFKFLELTVQGLLPRLWEHVGRPICRVLFPREPASVHSYSSSRATRVWWCPTGPLCFLPLHACGPFDGRDAGVQDLAISSYIPTLSALIRAQRIDAPRSRRAVKQLVVCQPNIPGRQPLPCAIDELAVLQKCFPNSGTFLIGPSATVSFTQDLLRTHDWLHISTHGTQDSNNPFESSLALYDGPLTLAALARARLPNADFAFLSACHSAKGTDWLPNESMHLAAGLMFAGYRSVVATAWAIADKDAPRVAEVFYGYLTREGREPVVTETAEALHHAIQALRRSGVPACRWVPFIHLGV